ncbi:hypothetical protein FRC00_006254 [Tulasnella sp. 408]|nr:hypothetical protein FRC00_006254 [Tulasnella sp. 408]
MNGVRRFLGGGGISLAGRSTSPSDPPSVPSTPQQESMPANTAMIMSPTSATMQGFSSRGGPGDDFGSGRRGGHGAAGSSSSFALPNSPTSPGSPSTTTTKALFFRKEGRRQNTITSMRNWTDDNNNNNDSNNDYSPSRPGQTAASSSSRTTHTSPQSSTSFSSSRPPLSSIATTATRFTTDPRASPAVSGTGSSLTWRNAHSSVNMKDELLLSLLASQAVVDSKDSEILSAEDVEELKRTEVETHMSLELQTAEERVTELEAEVQKVPDLEAQVGRLEEARLGWEKDKRDLEDRLRMAEERGRAAVAEATGNRNAEVEETMIQLRAELMAKDSENKRLLDEKRAIEEEKNSLRQSLTEHQAGATQEVIVAREALRAMCRANRVVTPLGETGLLPLIQSLEAHLSTFDQAKEQMMEGRERLNAELEEARREREEARREAREMESRLKQRSDSIDSTMRRTPSPLQPPIRRPSGDAATEYDRIVALLRPIWSILPSVSARASKMGSSSSGRMTPRSPKASNGRSPDSPVMSLSELDVRSLKALYDPRANYTSPTVTGEFSFEEFATRVQALIQDDRALVERLIRFHFNWPRFSDQFHADATQMLNAALNKGSKPRIIADKIEVVELSMGTQVNRFLDWRACHDASAERLGPPPLPLPLFPLL